MKTGREGERTGETGRDIRELERGDRAGRDGGRRKGAEEEGVGGSGRHVGVI